MDASWVPIEQITGKFRLRRKSGSGVPGTIPVYIIATELGEQAFEILKDREEMYQQLKRITLTGLESLWSAICLLEFVFFPNGTSFEIEKPLLTAQMVQGQLKYWDWYCENTDRFHSPIDVGFIESPTIQRWHSWGDSIIMRLHGMGMPLEDVRAIVHMLPHDAGPVIRRLVDDVLRNS